MQKIIPHLWYNKEAKEAAQFYTSIFPNAHIDTTTTIHNTPSGDCDIVTFTLMDYRFMAISAGPYFTFTPAISLMVNFDPAKDPDAKTHLDEIWSKLLDGGKALMAIGEYPFSERYGWVQDKYGLSWQLILTKPEGEERPAIMPSMLFVKDVYGKAEEASDFYLSVFQSAPTQSNQNHRGTIARYGADMAPDKEGTVMFTDFMLAGQWFVAMDSAHNHEFTFSEAISLIIHCETQEEIDYFWEKLSAVPESEQCGWLKDKYGVSWQVVPIQMNDMLSQGNPAQIDRVTKAFLAMKKFDLAKLQEAYGKR